MQPSRLYLIVALFSGRFEAIDCFEFDLIAGKTTSAIIEFSMHRLCYRASSHIASTVRRSEILDRTNRLYTASFSTRVRRRRRTSTRVATQTNNDEETELRMISQANDMVEKTNNFIARDKDGNEIPMDEYLKFASLSPWVPCPDPVALRALDIAKVGPDDVHYELGSGDGRLNFHAIDPSYGVKKSIGVDIDPALVQRCEQRKMKIHPAPKNLEFICADLTDAKDSTTATLWKTIQLECTVMTMYFVEDALLKVKPLIEKNLLGSNCKIVTIGYPKKGGNLYGRK